ncbi:MAG: ATP-binding cassette domain-containing protein [Acidobacteriia bacterium]|jgi:phospholipid/cholesterol/gamma-HCH transport system ATP-binding protein|nr:ATP-binding cassette domain-containing protein [Terriglobia bacterium]
MNDSGEPVIVFEHVALSFADVTVLEDVSFVVYERECKVLVGESGSGKTVLLKLAAGLLQPDAGRVVVLGQDLSRLSEKQLLDFRRRIGFVFQEGALFDSLTVAQNVAYRLLEEGVPEEETEERVREALRFVELEDAIWKLPGELSGGMRRRVSIARALMGNPPIVLYDSPTAGLDPVTAQTIITLILRLRDLYGVTSLLATHRLQDAFGLANFRFDSVRGRVVPIWETSETAAAAGAPPFDGQPRTSFLVLRDGRVYFEGEQHDILKSEDGYIRSFLV